MPLSLSLSKQGTETKATGFQFVGSVPKKAKREGNDQCFLFREATRECQVDRPLAGSHVEAEEIPVLSS